MTELLLSQYKSMYESSTDYTIDSLCERYNLDIKDLKGHETWVKATPTIESEPLPTPIIESEPQQELLPTVAQPSAPTAESNPTIDVEDLKGKIEEFKHKVVDECLSFMEQSVHLSEIKEFKDVVAIMDSIEKSYIKSNPAGPTINVLVQNITEKFQDDC